MAKTPEDTNSAPKRRVMDIRRDLECALAAQGKSTSFFSRAAPRQRNLHPEQFKYEHISLGLYDRWDCDTDMPKSKGDTFRLAVVNAFLEDLGKTTRDWDDICRQVVESPQEMQELYDEECHDLPVDEVRSVLTLDTLFLVSFLGGLFLPDFFGVSFPSAYATLKRASTTTEQLLMWDIIMLENQIPLPLIRRAFYLEWVNPFIDSRRPRTEEIDHIREAVDVSDEKQLFQHFCLVIVRYYYSKMPGYDRSVEIDCPFDDAKHLLDCLYCAMCSGITRERPMGDATRLPNCLCGLNAEGKKEDVNEFDIESHGLPGMCGVCRRRLHSPYSRRVPSSTTNEIPGLPSATQLRNAGIEFRGRPGGFRDVELKEQWFKAILYLPIMPFLGDSCEPLWRNLLAWEDHIHKNEFKAYLHLMDDLINTEKDVAMMMEGKHPVIVVHGLGSDNAVADLFNSMLNKIVFKIPPEWRVLRKQIYNYSSNKARQNRVEFRKTYCGKWWLIVSLVAGGILLVLNLLQSVYTLLSYYH